MAGWSGGLSRGAAAIAFDLPAQFALVVELWRQGITVNHKTVEAVMSAYPGFPE